MASGLNPVGGTGIDPLVAALSPALPLRSVGGAGDGFISVSDSRGDASRQKAEAPPAPSSATSLEVVREASSDAVTALSALSGSVQAFSAASPIVDFGSLRIEGVTTVLGAVDSRYMTEEDASRYVAAALNANEKNKVTASVTDDGRLQLRSKDGSAFTIEAIGALTSDQHAQAIDVGLATGTYSESATAAFKVSGPTFARERQSHAGGLATSGGERREEAARSGPAEQVAASARNAQADAAAREVAAEIADRKAVLEQRLASLLEVPGLAQTFKSGDVELSASVTRPGQVGRNPEPATIIADLTAARADKEAGLSVAEHIARHTVKDVVTALTPESSMVGLPDPDSERPSALISFEV